mgnify:CR=1 FL=1
MTKSGVSVSQVFSRNRLKGSPAFKGKIKDWGLSYLRRNRWKVAAVWDDDDLQQNAFYLYWRVCVYHAHISDEDEFLRLYKVAMGFLLSSTASACFPNPFNVGYENRCFSLTDEEGADIDIAKKNGAAVYDYVGDLEVCLDVIKCVPDELRGVCAALFREALGIKPMSALTRRRLKGNSSVEPINLTLARLFGFDQDRDVLSEVATCLSEYQLEE